MCNRIVVARYVTAELDRPREDDPHGIIAVHVVLGRMDRRCASLAYILRSLLTKTPAGWL